MSQIRSPCLQVSCPGCESQAQFWLRGLNSNAKSEGVGLALLVCGGKYQFVRSGLSL